MEVRPGSWSISETDKGSTGTRESLTSPHERRLTRTDRTRNVLSCKVGTDTLQGVKKRLVSQAVSTPRETEGEEKEEGSLNNYIVPMKAGKSVP